MYIIDLLLYKFKFTFSFLQVNIKCFIANLILNIQN